MRNIGGSMGIAASTTLLARRRQSNFDLLGSAIAPSSIRLRSVYSQIRSGFMARGKSDLEASALANATIVSLVERQSSMRSFIEVFRTLGLIFLLVLPLLLIMKSRRTKTKPAIEAI
jgi:MFS transporter, DHA2 family, multidrug resistance protein